MSITRLPLFSTALIGLTLASGTAFAGHCASAKSHGAQGYGMYPMPPMPPAPPAMGMAPGGMYPMPGRSPYGAPMGYGGYQQAPGNAAHRTGYSRPAERNEVASAAAPAAQREVSIRQMQFTPAVIEINAGETVSWRNGASMPHTVTGRGEGGPESGTLRGGQSFSHTFDEPGTYEYYCAIHPGMKGTVIVQ